MAGYSRSPTPAGASVRSMSSGPMSAASRPVLILGARALVVVGQFQYVLGGDGHEVAAPGAVDPVDEIPAPPQRVPPVAVVAFQHGQPAEDVEGVPGAPLGPESGLVESGSPGRSAKYLSTIRSLDLKSASRTVTDARRPSGRERLSRPPGFSRVELPETDARQGISGPGAPSMSGASGRFMRSARVCRSKLARSRQVCQVL